MIVTLITLLATPLRLPTLYRARRMSSVSSVYSSSLSFQRHDRVFRNHHRFFSNTNNNIDVSLQEETPLLSPVMLLPLPPPLTNGILAVNKPLNMSSTTVVRIFKRILTNSYKEEAITAGYPDNMDLRRYNGKLPKVRVGHGGTLDPLATGVLVVGINKGTKALHGQLKGSKVYSVTGRFGEETTTNDNEGEVLKRDDEGIWKESVDARFDSVISSFVGDIMQRPPIFSALHKDGRRMYDLARNNEVTEDDVEPRPVTIHEIEIISRPSATDPEFVLRVTSGSGVYIRSLIRDIGRELGSCANMIRLERIEQGGFAVDEALEEEDWTVEKILERLQTV